MNWLLLRFRYPVIGGMLGGIGDIDGMAGLCDEADQALAGRNPHRANGGRIKPATGQQCHIAMFIRQVEAAHVQPHVVLYGVDNDRDLSRSSICFRGGLHDARQLQYYRHILNLMPPAHLLCALRR